MSEPRNLRVNRLTQAMADLSESHAAQGRAITRLLTQMNERLASIDSRLASLAADVHALASEQILRVEDGA